MRCPVVTLLACLLTACAHHPVTVVNPPSAPAVEAQTEQVDAKAILKHMADTLARATSFSVTVDSSYDAVQDSGQKIEYGEIRHILIRRPNDLRIDLERRDGSQEEIRFDGKTMTEFTPGTPIFASLEHPGSVDDIIHYLVEGLRTPIPLALMLLTTMPEELDKRATEVDLVDNEMLDGRKVDHLAVRTNTVDFQVWVARADPPVPLRVVITYKNAHGQPQFSANLSDWNFAPQISNSAFTFVPPAGARPVPFMVPAASKP